MGVCPMSCPYRYLTNTLEPQKHMTVRHAQARCKGRKGKKKKKKEE